MKKRLLAVPVLMLVLSLVLAVTAGACPPPPDEEGCTPGYWKNHMDEFLNGDYYIVKYDDADHLIVKLEGDHYIVKDEADHYIVKLEGENAIGWLGGDHYIVKLGGDYYIVKLVGPDIEYLGEDHYIVKLGEDHYIVKGTMNYPAGVSLTDVLKARGPGSELLRHGAAAILNATNPYVDYGLTPDEVRAYFLAGDAAPLVEANEQYCPLN
jgi:hypothetical protein